MQGPPRPGDSLQSLCWPLVTKEAVSRQQRIDGNYQQMPQMNGANWPLSEPWRRNIGQPRCMGQGRCQGDAQRCNSKYRYGVDDVGRCPSHESCKTSYSCRNDHVPKSELCPQPCPKSQTCNRLTTRCFEWPIARRDTCPPINPNLDHKNVVRTDLMDPRMMPECCPTCHRTLVDLQAGPLAMNY